MRLRATSWRTTKNVVMVRPASRTCDTIGSMDAKLTDEMTPRILDTLGCYLVLL